MAPAHVGVAFALFGRVAEIAPAIGYMLRRASADTELETPAADQIGGACIPRTKIGDDHPGRRAPLCGAPRTALIDPSYTTSGDTNVKHGRKRNGSPASACWIGIIAISEAVLRPIYQKAT